MTTLPTLCLGAPTAPRNPRIPSNQSPLDANGEAAHICRLLQAAVAAAFAVPLVELRAPTRRSPMVAFARQCAIYLAHVELGLSLTKVARLFGRDRTTARHAVRQVEERRDDPAVDSVLRALEGSCVPLARGCTHRGEAAP